MNEAYKSAVLDIVRTHANDKANEIGLIRGYIECALWCERADVDGDGTDDSTFEQANYDESDLSELARLQIETDCEDFYHANRADLLAYASGRRIANTFEAMEYAGHDFFLTRNGHGAGFWDRGLGELGDRLTDAAKVYGTQGLYLGDDGLIYTHG